MNKGILLLRGIDLMSESFVCGDGDDGFVSFEIMEEGQIKSVKCDLYQLSVALHERMQLAESEGGHVVTTRISAAREVFAECDVPNESLSDRRIEQMILFVFKRINALKKKDELENTVLPNAE